MNVFVTIFVMLIAYAFSWAIFTGVAFLVCLCFAWEFSILKATGIWLIMCLLKAFLPGEKNK